MLDLAETELDISGPDPLGVGPRLGQHLMGHVDADHAACRAHLLRRQEAVDPGAAAEIDDHLARAHRRNCLRVAAT